MDVWSPVPRPEPVHASPWAKRLLLTLVVLFTVAAALPPLWCALFAVVPLTGTPQLLIRVISGQPVNRIPVPLEKISPALILATIAAEDQRFCTHDGFDFAAIKKAQEENADRAVIRGASTLTQQTAKNALLWPARSWLRKGYEAYVTVFMNALWSKRLIIETYLNLAEWGPGIYGAEAAAHYDFGATAATLTPEQAALLAAVLPDPIHWKANPPGPYVKGRAETLLARMEAVRNEGLAACVLGTNGTPPH